MYNQENKKLIQTATRLKYSYIIAISIIASVLLTSLFVIQYFLENQEYDARIINISGRQRMLSQKITKEVFIVNTQQTKQTQNELKEMYQLFEDSHLSLTKKQNVLNLAPNYTISDSVALLYQELEPYFQQIKESTQQIYTKNLEDSTQVDIKLEIDKLLEAENKFLPLMNEIVSRYELEAQKKIDTLRYTEFGVIALSILIILLVGLFILRPLINQNKTSVYKAVEVNKELSTLNDELQATKEELKRQSAYQKAILDNAGLMIIATDTTGIITSFNPTTEKTLGYTAKEVIGKESPALFHDINEIIQRAEELSTEFNEKIEVGFDVFVYKTLKGLPNTQEWIYVKKNKESIAVNLTVSAISQNEKVIGFLGIAEDITDRKKIEKLIEKQNAELQVSEKAIRKNYEKLQTTQELVNNAFAELDAQFIAISTTLGYVEMNTDRKIERVNQLFADWLGYEIDELKDKPYFDFIPTTKEDKEKYEKLWKTLEAGENYTDIFKRKNKDGKIVWLYGAYCPVKNKEGKVVKIIKIASNYSDQKIAEKELKRLSLVASKTDNAVIITDKNGIIEWVNEGFTKITEYSFEVAIGKKPSILLQGEDTDPLHIAAIRKGLNSQKQFIQEIYNYSKTGKGYWLELNITPVFNDENELVNFIAVQTNVTERKEYMEKIQKQTKRFDLAVSGANDGIWDWDIATDKMYFSPRWKSMLGYQEHEIENNYPAFEAILHEDDKERILERINKYVAGDIPTYEDEIRMKTKDGSWKWILTKGGLLRDREGKPIRMSGLHSDITDRKKIEEEHFEIESKIKSSNKRLQNLIENVGDLVFLLDKDFIFKEYYSSSDENLIMKPEFFLGKKVTEVGFPEKPLQLIVDALQKATQNKEKIMTEYTLKLPHGNDWFSLIASPILNDENEVEEILCVTRNITYIKQTEIEVQEQNVELSKQKEEAEEAFLELQTAQNQLIQSEKMAILGQLVASIAHEINTPLGAIRSSSNSIETILDKTLPFLPLLLKKLDDTTVHNFNELIKQSAQKTNLLSSRERRAVKYELIEKLEAFGIEQADEYANLIVDMNVYKESDLYLPLLKSTNAKEIFQTAYQLSTIVRSNKTVKVATDRAAKIIFALKNFARQDQTGEKSIVNINQGIETTLTLYYNQIKQGIDVTRDFGEVPTFMGYPDELIQVWTNLVHNAIQAMKNKGRLFIQTSIENNMVLVSIQDTGGGIPNEVQDKIFDAFFTTKPVGEGSGLGLDITKKIIEKHNGKIWFDSLEGKGTTFFIELPIG